MDKDRKCETESKKITRTEYEIALWRSHMARIRANEAACREPGEAIPTTSGEFPESSESGRSFAEEIKRLKAWGDRAWDEACLRAEKRVQAWNKLQEEIEKEKRKLSPAPVEEWDVNGQGLLFKSHLDQDGD